jgi:hypothetical protein
MKLCSNDALLPSPSTAITSALACPSEASISKKMKHFHTIDSDENSGNANTSDGEPPASVSPPSPSKPPTPRIRIRLGDQSDLRKRMSDANHFDFTVQPFSSATAVEFGDEDDEDEDDEDEDGDASTLPGDCDCDCDSSSSSSESSRCSDRPSPSTKQPKRVSFGVVQVQEYTLTLGDHPFSSSYPISLDWPHTAKTEYDLDLFEKVRQKSTKRSSRSRPCKHLNSSQRRSRLSTVSGIHPSELAKQDQQRHQQLLSELEQLYYSDCMDIDGEEDAGYPQAEPASPRNSEMSWPSQARFSWDDDDDFPLFEMDDFEPIEVARSKSMTELDHMDCSMILDSLYESDGDCAKDLGERGSGTSRTVTGRRRKRRQASRRCDSTGSDRRSSNPW